QRPDLREAADRDGSSAADRQRGEADIAQGDAPGRPATSRVGHRRGGHAATGRKGDRTGGGKRGAAVHDQLSFAAVPETRRPTELCTGAGTGHGQSTCPIDGANERVILCKEATAVANR